MTEKPSEKIPQEGKALESLPSKTSSSNKLTEIHQTNIENISVKNHEYSIETLELEKQKIELEKQKIELEKQKIELKKQNNELEDFIQEKKFQRRLNLVQLVLGGTFKGSVGIIILIAGIQFTTQDKMVGPYLMGIGATAAGISTKEASESAMNLLAGNKKE